MSAIVNVVSPILISSGSYLDGVTTESDVWVRSGEHTIDIDTANSLAGRGYVEIVSIDGATFSKPPCCGSH